ncbi:retrovirus-related pol polyprotein from transposon TNT 1-94 [Tanacetum coccineum]
MSRTMLNEQSIPQKFWCNAVDTSTYIINRVSIRRILGKTPYELLRGRKPNLNYFRVFGSKCFVLNTKDYLTKFDPKSYEGVFLGYSQNSKAYIILNKQTMKVEESLNVTFDETPPPPKTSPLEDDELVEEEAIEIQTTLAISTTEAEYVSAGKACQQALWMKQALIDYGVRLYDISIMCDNKGAIDLKKVTSEDNIAKKQPRRKQRKDTEVHQPSGSTEPITDEAANEEHVPIHSNDPLLCGEDRFKLNELMEPCTNLSQRVLDLENTKTSQAAEIAKLKERVKKLERKNKSRTPGLKSLRKVGRTARIESSEDEGLGAQEDAFKQGRKITDLDADVEDVEVEKAVSTAKVTTVSATTTTVDELTLAQTLIKIKAAKPKAVTTAAITITTAITRPKARGVVVQEPSKFRTTTSSSQTSQLPQAKDKGNGKMVEPEKPLKKKDQILIDEEIAQRLQAQLNAELEEEDEIFENDPWFIRNNPLILKKWNPDVNLLKEDGGNVPVWVKLHGVPVTAFSVDGLNAIATKIDTPLIALIEVRDDVELKDNIVVAMPKLVGGGDECPKNKVSDVVKKMKKPSQTNKGVPVGPKVGFQPTKQVYRHVSKKNNVSTSGNKKKDVEPTKENAESSSTCTTPIVEKIDKIERLIIDGTTTLVDDEGIPLKMVDSLGGHDSDDEVASVDNDMANFLASKDVGYDTNSLLEQREESYRNGDYDYEPYDDDMYEGHDIPDKIQDICDNLDIKVRGRKKK